MMAKSMIFLLAFMALACRAVTASTIYSHEYTMPLGTSEIQARTPSDESLGNYFTIAFTLPADVTNRKIHHAFLEFYTDVSAKSVGGFVNKLPVVEVFALTNAFSGSLDPDDFDQTTKTALPVAAGNDRRVRIDITRIVKKLAKSPSATHTLVVGSLEGSREGVFTMKTNVLPDGALAQIRFHFQ